MFVSSEVSQIMTISTDMIFAFWIMPCCAVRFQKHGSDWTTTSAIYSLCCQLFYQWPS